MAKVRDFAALGALMLMGSAFFILWQAGLPTTTESPSEIDQRIPTFTASTLTGELLTIQPEMGYPMLINFWATWCVPCIEEMPLLEALHQEGVRVIGINAGLEDQAMIRAWIEQHQITFPIIPDDHQRTLEALFKLRSGLPTTFFIDSDGIIQYVERGKLNADSLTAGLQAMGWAKLDG